MNLTSRLLFVCLMLCVATGCGSMNRPFPAKGRYAMSVGSPPPSPTQAASQSGSSSAGGLRVEQIRVAEPYDGVPFVYRTGELVFTTDYYNEFIAAPGKLLTESTVALLRDKGIFSSVTGPWATSDSRWRLESTVSSLYGDYRDSGAPKAVIEAHFILVEESPEASRVVGQWTLTASEPMKSATPADFAAACGEACKRMMSQLADAMKQTVTTRQSTTS